MYSTTRLLKLKRYKVNNAHSHKIRPAWQQHGSGEMQLEQNPYSFSRPRHPPKRHLTRGSFGLYGNASLASQTRKCFPDKKMLSRQGNASQTRKCFPDKNMLPRQGNAFQTRKCFPDKEMLPRQGNAFQTRKCFPDKGMLPSPLQLH